MAAISFYVFFSLLILLALFHFLVLIRLIPHEIVWGGRLQRLSEMYLLETISLLISLLVIYIVGVMGGLWENQWIIFHQNLWLWIFTGFFFLSAVGNFLSRNKWEQRLFGPIAIMLACCSLGMMG